MVKIMRKNLLKILSVLLLISGLFILFLVIAIFFNWEILNFFWLRFEITLFFMSAFKFPEIWKVGLIAPIFFIMLSCLDLLCSFYVYKGNRLFRSIAVIRSFLASLLGIVYTCLTFNSGLLIVEGLFYFIYYGLIFVFLELSKRNVDGVIYEKSIDRVGP